MNAAVIGVSSSEPKPGNPKPGFSVVQQLQQRWRKGTQRFSPTERWVVAIASLAMACTVLGIRQVGWLQPAELAVFDQLVRLMPDRSIDDRLLLVEISEADFRAQKRFPLSDQVIAQALANLQQYQPWAIGLDIYRDIPNEPGSQALAQQLKQSNVITVTYIGNADSETIPAPPNLADSQVGFNDLLIDPDGVVRRNLMFVGTEGVPMRSLPVQLAFLYLARQQINASITEAGEIQLHRTVFHRLQPNSGGYQAIDAQGYQTLLRYRSATGSIRRVPLQQVLDRQIDPAWVRGKVVLIGATAPSAKDSFYTPYSPAIAGNRQMPGVLIHAQAVSQMLSVVLDGQPLFWFWADRTEAIWILGWAIVGSLVTYRIRRWRLLMLGGCVSLGILYGVSYVIFAQGGWVPVIAPALALVLAGSSVFTYCVLHNAFFDALTDLPNRALFLKRLQRSILEQRQWQPNKLPSLQFAVLFLDLDRFKVVNDNLGHEVGDQVLLLSSQRLKAGLRPKDVLARVGGDEFAILLQGIEDLEQVTQVADDLQHRMALPFGVDGQQIYTSISIGIAVGRRDRTYRPEDLLRDAHTAMYRAKAMGKARHEVFATGMRVQVVRRLQLETDLRHAIEQHQFQLHYQPIVALATGQTAGFEALVRWQHPEHGFISPAEFIPVAEETGLIIPLGKWIFQTACHQLKLWLAEFESSLTVSVNLSGQQFTQANLVEYIEQTLHSTGLAGANLKLEITESVAMNDVEAAIAMLQRLKALDLQLSIDDFGTGYSSLSYLHRFPVDTLKVDRSFVSRMDDKGDDAAIVQTIVGLAHGLSMDVVAEGVETAAQLAKLQTLHCEYGQGYFFSRPLPAEAATALLAANTHWLERQ